VSAPEKRMIRKTANQAWRAPRQADGLRRLRRLVCGHFRWRHLKVRRGWLVGAFRRSASLFLREAKSFRAVVGALVRALACKARMQEHRENERVCVIASEAKQSRAACDGFEAVLDCFVATLLAMTKTPD
jgi:hypothetical protein